MQPKYLSMFTSENSLRVKNVTHYILLYTLCVLSVHVGKCDSSEFEKRD